MGHSSELDTIVVPESTSTGTMLVNMTFQVFLTVVAVGAEACNDLALLTTTISTHCFSSSANPGTGGGMLMQINALLPMIQCQGSAFTAALLCMHVGSIAMSWCMGMCYP